MNDRTPTSNGAAGTPPAPAVRKCPDCGHRMVQMWSDEGRETWVCSNFPQCGRVDPVYTPLELAIHEWLRR